MSDKSSFAAGSLLKIDKAQKTLYGFVVGAFVLLGIAIAIGINFVKYIIFNSKVIERQDASIKNFSSVISNSGACLRPAASDGIYTVQELDRCVPDEIDPNSVLDSLKYNVLVKAASDINLSSVQRRSISSCVDPDTGEDYTAEKLNRLYVDAYNENDRDEALSRIKTCSALRTVFDALPVVRNDSSTLASLNNLYLISNYEFDSLSVSSSSSEELGSSIGSIPISLSVKSVSSEELLTILDNFNKSIRDFSVTSFTLQRSDDGSLEFSASANAYYSNNVSINKREEAITANSPFLSGNIRR